MRFKKIEVTDQNGHKTEFLKDIDTGKHYSQIEEVLKELRRDENNADSN